METQTENRPDNVFKRKSRVGMSILTLKTGQSEVVKVKNYRQFQKRDGDTIPCFDVINLRSGEEQTLWIDGGMKGLFAQTGGLEKAIGHAYEITHTGQKEFEHDTEGKVKVNTYDIYEVEAD